MKVGKKFSKLHLCVGNYKLPFHKLLTVRKICEISKHSSDSTGVRKN